MFSEVLTIFIVCFVFTSAFCDDCLYVLLLSVPLLASNNI